MELYKTKRWKTWSAQQSNRYGMFPCMYCLTFWVFFINTTAYHLGQCSPRLLLLKRAPYRNDHRERVNVNNSSLVFSVQLKIPCMLWYVLDVWSENRERDAYTHPLCLYESHSEDLWMVWRIWHKVISRQSCYALVNL